MSTRGQLGVECTECGASNQTDPIAEGEVLRATTCAECGEWFTVYSEE